VPEDIEEPSEAEGRVNLELDHDTKGETGRTGIADSIFRKIDNVAVSVGDVTPVGNSSRKGKAAACDHEPERRDRARLRD
jgi:hypothetical protein